MACQINQLLYTGSDPVQWNSVNWNSVNWNSVNWNSVNWNSVNWNSTNLGSGTGPASEQNASVHPPLILDEDEYFNEEVEPDAPGAQIFLPALGR